MGKRGPPVSQIDWSALDALLRFKVSCRYCADHLGCSEDKIQKQIRKKYRMTFGEYAKIKIERTGKKLQQKAIEMAFKGNATMLIFCLKNISKWKDLPDDDIDQSTDEMDIIDDEVQN